MLKSHMLIASMLAIAGPAAPFMRGGAARSTGNKRGRSRPRHPAGNKLAKLAAKRRIRINGIK